MLSKEKLNHIKEDLEETKKDLEEEIASLEISDFGDDIDSGDEESDESEEQINNEATRTLLEERLDDVVCALEKIIAGTYGVCERCQAELSMEMIEVDPESRLCKTCKKADASS